MFEIALRFGAVGKHCGSEGKYLMSEWLDGILLARKNAKANDQASLDLLKLAIAKTPVMFSDLANQITEDVRQFTGATGVRIDTKQTQVGPSKGTLEVSRKGIYPEFSIHLIVDNLGQPLIHGYSKSRISSGAQESITHYDVEIAAKSQGQYFYHVDGSEWDKDQVSGHILSPFLRTA